MSTITVMTTQTNITPTVTDGDTVSVAVTNAPITATVSNCAVSSTGEYIPASPFTSATIQAAIDAAYAAGGGVVFIPPPSPWARISLNAPIVLQRGVTIRGVYPGASCTTSGSSWDPNVADMGTVLTYPGGTVFTHDVDVNQGVNSSLDGVIIESLGFDDVACVISCGAMNSAGLDGAVLRDLVASRVSGVAFDLCNILNCHISNLLSTCVQFLRVTSDNDDSVVGFGHQPGNSFFSGLYCYVLAGGEALPSVHLRSIQRGGHGTLLNFLHFERLQVNRYGLNGRVAGGSHITLDGGDTFINGCILNGLDLEGEAEYAVRCNRVLNTTMAFIAAQGDAVCDATVYMRTVDNMMIHATAYGVTVDMDSTCTKVYATGTLDNVKGAYRPLGTYTDVALADNTALTWRKSGTTYEVPTYENVYGSGYRNNLISITASGAAFWNLINDPGWNVRMIDGDFGNYIYTNNTIPVAGEWLQFDFGVGAKKRITEIMFYSDAAVSFGVWQWQASDNGTDWTNIGAQWELATVAGAKAFSELSQNATGYRYYRMLGVSGNSSWGAYWREIEFKIGNMV